MHFVLLPNDYVQEEDPLLHPRPYHGVRCPCGRFAKFLRGQWHYNGAYNSYTEWTRCSKCGDQWNVLV